MHVLLAPDRFASADRSGLVPGALADGWRAGAPHDSVDVCPLSDGGAGFGALVAGALDGEVLRPAPGVVVHRAASGASTAYVDSVVGLGLADGSAGLGEQLACALDAGAGRVVVGLAPAQDAAVVPDAGAGLLGVLGVPGLVGQDTARLGAVTPDDLSGLDDVVARLAGVDLVGAYATDVGLLGLHGASALAAQVGALSSEDAQVLERSVGHFSHTLWSSLRGGPRRSLALAGAAGAQPTSAGGRSRDVTGLPGAGAGAGTGWLLALLGGRLLPGAAVVADLVGLSARAAQADLVVTAREGLDGATFHGSGAEQAARAAAATGLPCVVLAGHSVMNRREYAASGLSAVYVVSDEDDSVDVPALGALAERAARSWSPRRTAAGS